VQERERRVFTPAFPKCKGFPRHLMKMKGRCTPLLFSAIVLATIPLRSVDARDPGERASQVAFFECDDTQTQKTSHTWRSRQMS
jgi:hypothetical protein